MLIRYIIILSIFSIGHLQSQSVVELTDIPIFYKGKQLQNPFVGGLKAGQFSNVDIDGDGKKDLFVFDRNSSVVSTFINKGEEGEINYEYAPEYIDIFPKPRTFGLLVDFNGDGIEDLFKDPSAGGIAGIEVWRGKRDANGLYYELVKQREDFYDILYYMGNGFPLNVYNAPIDIPGIVDVDGDGDIDVLSFEIDGAFLNYYRNYAVEQNLGLDTFVMKFEKLCFGGFKETMFSSEVVLSDNMVDCADGVVSDPGNVAKPRHAGSTVNAFDGDCDGDIDLILGDFLTSTIVYLENGGTAIKDWITDQDVRFPSYDESAILEVFLATFYIDVNNDDHRDLIVTPNQEDVGKNQNHVWLYLNEGTDCSPQFKLSQKDFLVDEMLHFSRQSHPQFFDFNADGLLDVLIGNGGEIIETLNIKKKLWVLENIGSNDAPQFELLDIDYLNFENVPEEVSRIAPDMADIDNDGDLDLFLGSSAGDVFFYENTAGPNMPYEFADPIGYYQELFVGGNSSPDLFDLNDDGLLDMIIGETNNEFDYFENVGTKESPLFNSDLSAGNNTKGLGNIYSVTNTFTRYGSPVFFISDDRKYLLQGVADGRIRFYDNISANHQDTFNLITDKFGAIYKGERVTVDVADINGDNKYDLVVGNDRGGLNFFSTDIEVGEIVNVTDYSSASFEVNVYPNPVRDQLHIDAPLDNAQLVIRDVTGRLVFKDNQFNERLIVDARNWLSGIYMVTLVHDSGVVSSKIIKQ